MKHAALQRRPRVGLVLSSSARWQRWQLAAALGLLVLLPLAVRMGLDSGITWDELVQLEYGQHVLAWFRSGFTDTAALSYRNLYLYGGLFDLPAQWLVSTELLPWGPYETRHVLSALLAVLGIVGVWLTARRIAGPRAGLLAAAMLALTPTWVGHGLFNPKDIPFGTAAIFVAYASVCIALAPSPLSWGAALRAGVALGCALGIRSGGMFLCAFPVFAAFGRVALDSLIRRNPRASARAAGLVLVRFACVVPVIWAVMISTWPWAQLDPLYRPLEAAEIAAHFDWGGVMRFEGRTISTGDMPMSYLPVWFAVTLADIYLLAMLCAVLALFMSVQRSRIRILRSPRTLALITLILYVMLPPIGVIIQHSTIYDAHRHFLFLLPVMATLAGLALDAVLFEPIYPRALRIAAGAIALVLAGVTVHDEWVLHPYEYVYFNRITGGLARQGTRFETDYWGASYREGFDWVVHHVDPGGSKRVTVAACNMDFQMQYYRSQWNARRFVVPKRPDQAEIYLAFTRGGCDRSGTLIHTVEREGIPLLQIWQRVPKKRR